ncbi:hypothetical protein B0H17DRAFT_1065910 [Mycena rosella]|uniref:Uncharacterized protein n=1 Tax=Mycena rosella TaxID=1033263 RepID=A0AAD7GDP3_MYCRO|nr:hypothetical protein B0H17DRAFT_1065910 [Mycena rosella]
MHVNFVPFLAPLVVLASLANAQLQLFCPDAVRLGTFTFSPKTVNPGATFTIVANMTCANYLGYTPKYLDYYIEDTTNNNGHEYPTLIARRTYNQSADPPLDIFTAVLPSGFWFVGAEYQLYMYNSYERTAPAGDTVTLVGAVAQSINITGY